MKAGFRQSMSWLHTWAGLLVGWILFAVFLSGTLAYFNSEITLWMQPETSQTRDRAAAIQKGGDWLKANHPDAAEWTIFPANERGGAIRVQWTPAPETPDAKPVPDPERDLAFLDPVSGQKIDARETDGGSFFYRLHFDMHYMPRIWGRWIVGVCAMFMFVAILTGIVVHRKIFADFFTLRFNKGQRSWLDAHNIAGVFALPFHLMITFTGFVTLASLYMPWGIAANFANDDDYFASAFPQPVVPDTRGAPAPPFDVSVALATAAKEWNGGVPSSVAVFRPSDTSAVTRMFQSSSEQIDSRAAAIVIDRQGEVVWSKPGKGAATQTFGVMVGLHAGRFAGPDLRWLYFISGLVGTAMIGSGLVLWTVKRKRKHATGERPQFGVRLVEALNIGTMAGFPLGVAAYFLANRIVPLGVHDRAEVEIGWFFAAWGFTYIYAAVRPNLRAWLETLAAAAVAFAAVPLVSALTTERNLVATLLNGEWTRAGVDLTLIAAAAAFAFAARKVAGKADAAPSRPHRAREQAHAS